MPQDWLWRRRVGGKLGSNRGPIGDEPEKLVSSSFGLSGIIYLFFFERSGKKVQTDGENEKILRYVR